MNLSKQEYKIAELLTLGNTEKEIASTLFIAPKTVNNHTYNIRKKLKARNAVDIARKFILSLDNPKQYFTALVCLLIQFHIIINIETMELRRPARTGGARVTRTIKSGRKIND